MKLQNCLTLVDFQNDFVAPGGALTFDNGLGDVGLIKRMRNFFAQLPAGHFDHGIITYDTHPAEIYKDSEEAARFPLHCDPATKGWHLAINPLQVFEKIPDTQLLKKDSYDMWGQSADPLWPEFINTKQNVTIVGVASDICNRAAMEGWLKKGAKVTIIDDLTRGIFKETKDVVAEEQYRHFVKDGSLRIIHSRQFFNELNNINTITRGERQ